MKPQEGTVFTGMAVAALGAALAAIAYVRPQELRVPPAVMYACALAFLLAGWLIVAQAREHRLLKAWLPVLLLACLVSPAVWLGFGSGRRQCTLSVMQGVVRIFGSRTDLPCRIGFGIAAVIGIAMVLGALRNAIRSSRRRPD